jgi:hypothetical protein
MTLRPAALVEPASAAAAAALTTLDPKTLAHLGAIQAGLSEQEQALAQALIGKFGPAELRGWLAELTALSVPDAIAEIRAVLGTKDAGPPAAGAPSADVDGGGS